MNQATRKQLNKHIIDEYFEEISYDDYDPSENDGEVDHSGTACKICSTLWDDNDFGGIKHLLAHFWTEHQDVAMGLKKSHSRADGMAF